MRIFSKISFDDKHFFNGTVSIVRDIVIVSQTTLILDIMTLIIVFLMGGTEISRFTLFDLKDYNIEKIGSKSIIKIHFRDGRFLRFRISSRKTEKLISYFDRAKYGNEEYNIF